MDTFEVHDVSTLYRKVTCRCGKSFLVDETWPGGRVISLPCRFCSRTSRIPDGPALIYDSNETVSVTLQEAEVLADYGLIGYSPMDGPNGIMYRPAQGVTMQQVKDSLAREV